jgi:hypothetical protein
MKLWREGERSRAVCESCGRLVTTRFERRTVDLEDPEVSVPEVLVAICQVCGEIVAIPHQSTPRLQEARRGITPRREVRVPPLLNDALGLIAGRFSVRAEDFGGLVIRYYLQRIGREPETAGRIKAFASSPLAQGKTTGRISLRLADSAWEDAWKAARGAGLRTKSEVFRGILAAAAVDSEVAKETGLPPSPDFKAAIETIALASSGARPADVATVDPHRLKTRKPAARNDSGSSPAARQKAVKPKR